MIFRGRHPFGLFLVCFNLLVYLFLLAPIIVVAASSFGATEFLTFPPEGFSLRWYQEALADSDYRETFRTSLIVASVAAILATLVGGLAAVALAKFRFRGRNALAGLFLSPLMLPTLVLAVALLLFFNQFSSISGLGRLILGHLVITIPYILRTTTPVLERLDPSLEEAAQNLGATPLSTFFLVTLPIIRPGLLAGSLLAFMISFDELVLALFLSSPLSETLPMKIYSDVQYGLDPTAGAVSTLLIVVTVIFMLVFQAVGGIRRLM